MQGIRDIILDEGIAGNGTDPLTAQTLALKNYLDRARLFLFLIALMLVLPLYVSVNTVGAAILAHHTGTLALGVAWVGSGILSRYHPVWGFVLALVFFLLVLFSGVPLTLNHWSQKVLISLVLIIGITVAWMYRRMQSLR
jgi:hypothetical protein